MTIDADEAAIRSLIAVVTNYEGLITARQRAIALSTYLFALHDHFAVQTREPWRPGEIDQLSARRRFSGSPSR
jgi:hypothetical protein